MARLVYLSFAFCFYHNFGGSGSVKMRETRSLAFQPLLANLEEMLAEIAMDRAALEAKEASLREMIASAKRFMALDSGEAPPPQEVVVPKGSFKQLTLIQAAVKYLGMAQTGQTSAQITEGLKRGGFDTKAKYLKETVRSALNRQGPAAGLVKVDAQWWLKEWPQTPREAGRAGMVPVADLLNSIYDPHRDSGGVSHQAFTPKPLALLSQLNLPELPKTPTTIVEAMQQVLRDAGEGSSLHLNDIHERVHKLGLKSKKNSMASQLVSDRQCRFTKTGPNLFRLATPEEQRVAMANRKPRWVPPDKRKL